MATRKQTSDRVSRVAGKLLQRWKERPAGLLKRHTVGLTWGDALALAASCLSQDETPRKKVKR